MSSLAGRVAIITGASRGIGRALALGLAQNGCHIVIAAKSTESTEKLPGSIYTVAKEIEALGGQALPVPALKPVTRPWNSTEPPYASALRVTGCPGRRWASWFSLKFASTQTSSSGTTAMRTSPGLTRCPSCTERRATNPATGAGMRVLE